MTDIFNLQGEKRAEFRMSALGIWHECGEIPILSLEDFKDEISYTNISRMWIIGEAEEFDNEDIYEVIYKNITQLKKYTYWLPTHSKSNFDIFLSKIKTDLSKENLPLELTNITLECIVSESTLPTILNLPLTVYLINPFDNERRRGREVFYGENDAKILVALPKQQTDLICDSLEPIYFSLLRKRQFSDGDGLKSAYHFPKNS